MSGDRLFPSLEYAETFLDLDGERVPAQSYIEELYALVGVFRQCRAAQGVARHHSIIGAPLPKSAICVEHDGHPFRSANGTFTGGVGSNKFMTG